jgi:hypothetical protein
MQKKGAVPKWQQGNRLAKRILDNADPGYKYWNPAHVQSSKARITLANRIAFIDILVQPVTPLIVQKNDRMYGWLVEGTDDEVTKIHGGTGLCSKLLHTFAQITHLASLMAEVRLHSSSGSLSPLKLGYTDIERPDSGLPNHPSWCSKDRTDTRQAAPVVRAISWLSVS